MARVARRFSARERSSRREFLMAVISGVDWRTLTSMLTRVRAT